MASVSSDSLGVDDKLAKSGAFLYDLEIISAIHMPGELRYSDLHYCDGWEDYAGMGISVVTAYDFVESSFRIYLKDNFDELKTTINSRQIIIGFNNRRFDDNVLAANDIYVPEGKSYDIWASIMQMVPDGPGMRRGFALKDMLKANGMAPKSGLGSDAPKWAQRGRWGRLINYCLDDTRLTLQLLRLACADVMISPKVGGYLKIKKPWEVVKIDEDGLF
tara:strand:+ start:97 stop:753 length:657 start_codon:yes stop_codon:yes gene_type:complete